MYVLCVLSSIWIFRTSAWAGQNTNYLGIRDLAPGQRECMVDLECPSYGSICHEYKFQSRKWMSPAVGQQLSAAEDRV